MMNWSRVVSNGVLRFLMILLLMRVLFLLMCRRRVVSIMFSRGGMGSGNMRGHMMNDRSLVVDHSGVMGGHVMHRDAVVQNWSFLEDRSVVHGGSMVKHWGFVDNGCVVGRIVVDHSSVVVHGSGMVHRHSVVKNRSLMDAGVVHRGWMVNDAVMNWSTVVGMVML
jgi:hypothetical protein